MYDASMRALSSALSAAAILMVSYLTTPCALACAIAPPAGEEARVAEEEAIIVWDAAEKTQQFVRRAAFHTTSARLGFLVPTPSRPTLSEVDQGVFAELAHAIAPRYETISEGYNVELSLLLQRSKSETSSAGASGVTVLERSVVAGMDAAILEADSATALSEWLAQNGFLSTSNLADWLSPYVKSQWKITAFKYAGELHSQASPGTFGTKAVNLTFQTDRPFYPYREPLDARSVLGPRLQALPRPPRLLRLFFIGTQRMDAQLNGTPWRADLLYAAAPELRHLSRMLTLPKDAVVTAFHDKQDPRPGIDEVYFAPAADQSRVEQPPIVFRRPRVILLPLEIMIPLFGTSLGVWIALRNRRQKREIAQLPRP